MANSGLIRRSAASWSNVRHTATFQLREMEPTVDGSARGFVNTSFERLFASAMSGNQLICCTLSPNDNFAFVMGKFFVSELFFNEGGYCFG